jgi:hypothetical protein
MKRFGKKILLLGLLFLVMLLVLNYLGVTAGSIYKDGAAMVCETKREMIRSGEIHYEKDKVNVLFMGTSRILAGIVPAYFDELTGGKTFSYNLALPGLAVGSYYFVLRDYLEKNPPPRYVIMQLHINRCRNCKMYYYYASQGVTTLDEMVSLFKNNQDKSIIFNFIFPSRMYKFHTVRYLYDRVFRPSRVRQTQKKNRIILNRMIENRGYYFIEEQAVARDNILPDGFIEEPGDSIHRASLYDPFIDPYTKLLFDLALEHGVNVLLIQPAYLEHQYLQYEEMPLQYASILDRYGNVSMAKEGWKLKLYKNRLFSDPAHLNKTGAARYTREIYKEFIDVFPGI